MFDTMTTTKIASGLCGALLILLLGKWAGEGLYHVGGGHGDHAQGYIIDTGAEEVAETDEPEVSFGELLLAADVGKGARVFNKCKACHKLEDGGKGTGPHLYGVVGRDKGAVDGFGYSSTLASLEGDWTPDALNDFLEKPADYAPGTSMGFSGLRKPQDRANVVAYLDSIDD